MVQLPSNNSCTTHASGLYCSTRIIDLFVLIETWPVSVKVALIVNCGYARVCIHQNSSPESTGRRARESIDTSKRMINFKEQFSGTYNFPEGYFTVSDGHNRTQFDRDCNKILDGFRFKFLDRESYLTTFSNYSKWCELSVAEKKLHTLTKCARCYELHQKSQISFPLKPIYHHKPTNNR